MGMRRKSETFPNPHCEIGSVPVPFTPRFESKQRSKEKLRRKVAHFSHSSEMPGRDGGTGRTRGQHYVQALLSPQMIASVCMLENRQESTSVPSPPVERDDWPRAQQIRTWLQLLHRTIRNLVSWETKGPIF